MVFNKKKNKVEILIYIYIMYASRFDSMNIWKNVFAIPYSADLFSGKLEKIFFKLLYQIITNLVHQLISISKGYLDSTN